MVKRNTITAMLLFVLVVLILTYFKFSGSKISKSTVTSRNPQGILLNKYMHDLEETGFQNDSALRIIVMAQFRTGSTFTGELLNQNPTLFYLYEPLHTFRCVNENDILGSMNNDEDTNAKLITRLIGCHFSSKFVDCVPSVDLENKRITIARTIRDKSKATPDLFRGECLKYSGRIAMKIIRGNIDDIKEVLESTKLNIKIIHLVRDPRGVANSRRFYIMWKAVQQNNSLVNNAKDETPVTKRYESIQSLTQIGLFDPPQTPYRATINDMCRRMRQNIGTAISKPEWLKDRYKLVRYEDLATRPVETTKKIYEFLGEPVPSSVLRWVEENTKDTVKSSYEVRNTHKNSSATWQKWRESLSFYEANQVQDICGDVMKMLGYNLIIHHSELRDPTFPVMLSVPLDSDKTIV